MEHNTVARVAKRLNINKDTLRYYDRIKLISPKREKNGYRYYSNDDIIKLMYIEVLKYANFSLSEMDTILNGSCENIEICKQNSTNLIRKKQEELEKQILQFQKIIEIGDVTIEVFNRADEQGFSALEMVTREIYENIRKEEIL